MTQNESEGSKMTTYNVTVSEQNDNFVLLKMGFGNPAGNNEIVVDAVRQVKGLELAGGKLVKLNGPASLPVAVAISHELSHIFGAVAAYDPKLSKYVVSVSHSPNFNVGDLID